MKTPTIRVDLRIASVYAIFGGLWILLSDTVLAALVSEHAIYSRLQTWKGWAFVAVSALLIFILLRRELAVRNIIEGKFAESEERYRQLFENSIDAVLLTAPDGKILSADLAACNMLGRTEEEIQRMGWNGVVDLTDPRLKPALEERARTGKFHGELTFLRADGTKFEGEVSTNIFKNASEEDRTSMIIREITKRKQAEQALRESEERLRLSTELANVAVWEYSFITNSMSRSKNHDRLYGLDWQSTWAFETFLNATHPDDREYSNGMIQQSVTPGGPDHYTFDFRVVYPDQSIHWLNVVGQVAERDSKGAGTLVRGCLMDITARKQAEEKLRLSEERFSNAFHASPAGMTITRIADGKFVDANEAFCNMFEFSREEVIGHTSTELNMWTPEERKKLIEEQVRSGG